MGLLQELDNARRVAGRNLQDLFSDPSAYAERLTDRLRNMNAGVIPIATPTELTNRPQTLEERVEDWSGRLDPGSGMMGVIKPKGGNWLKGQVEGTTNRLRNPIGDILLPGENIGDLGETARNAYAINDWIDKKLLKYIKNDLAAPTDPVRLLADKFPEEKAAKLAQAEAKVQALRNRQQEQATARGVPEEYLTQTRQDILAAEEARDRIAENTGLHFDVGNIDNGRLFAKRSAAGFDQGGMATSPQASNWENLADHSVSAWKAGDRATSANVRAMNPWITEVDPGTDIYSLTRGNDLGFQHLTDELANSLREGRLTPDQLGKMNMEQAVRHVAEINALRKVNKNKDLAVDMEDMPIHTLYPDTGMSWRQLKMPDRKIPEGYEYNQRTGSYVNPWENVQPISGKSLDAENYNKLQKWLTQEGDAMGHCVGGYCDDVASGQTQIYSLRDAKGKPHTTIEVDPNLIDMVAFSGNHIGGMLNQEDALAAIRKLQSDPKWVADMKARGADPSLKSWIQDIKIGGWGIPRVVQIKGPNNATPDPKYFPMIQDFLRQGKWGEIEDAHNTGLTQEEINALLNR